MKLKILWTLFSVSRDLERRQRLTLSKAPGLKQHRARTWPFSFVGVNFSSWLKMRVLSQPGGKAFFSLPIAPVERRCENCTWKAFNPADGQLRSHSVWIRILEPCQNVPYAKLVKTIKPEQRNNTANHTDTKGTTSHWVKGQHHLATHEFINGRFTEI